MKVVVIGSGLAGTLISNKLAQKADVTLLEKGEKDVISYPPMHFFKKKLAGVKTFCFGGGGTTNLWHNGLIPIHQQDVTKESFKSVLAKIEPYHDEAAKNLFWLDNPYTDEYKKVYAATKAVSDETGCFPDGVDCLLYPKKFSRLKAASGVNAVYLVSDIDFVLSDGRVTSLKYRVGAKEYCIEADIIILSAGCFGSPLLVKKILSGSGVPSETSGIGLADHPIGFIGKVRLKKSVNLKIKQLSVRDWGNFESRTVFRLKSSCGKYTGSAFLRPAITMENRLSIYKYKSLLGASSGVERIKNMFDWRLFHPDIIAEIVSHLFGLVIPGCVYNIFFLFEQKRGGNFVKKYGDGLGVDWRISPEELEIYRDMVKKMSGMLDGMADEINMNTEFDEDWLWSAAHHSGTLSMGRAEDDLVDTDLKLKALENVFVCDGSTIQEHSYANTGLTIGGLAMRLADRINHEFK